MCGYNNLPNPSYIDFECPMSCCMTCPNFIESMSMPMPMELPCQMGEMFRGDYEFDKPMTMKAVNESEITD